MSRLLRRRPPGARAAALGLLLAAACGAPVTPMASVGDPVTDAQRDARARIAAEQSIDVAALPAHTVGVTPFAVDPADSTIAPLAYGLADLLMTDLARSGRIAVVDRLRIDALLRELSLVSTASFDPSTAPRTGRLLGARRLVVGGIGRDDAGGLRIDARVADVATTAMTEAVSGRAPLDDVLEAEKAVAFRIIEALGVTLTPAERAAIEQRPTRNIAALLAYARGVRWEVYGDYVQALTSYEQAVALDGAFVRARERLEAVRLMARGGSARLVMGASAGEVVRDPGLEALWRVGGVTVDALNRSFYGTARTGRIGGGASDPASSALIADLGIIIAGQQATPP